MNYLKLLVGFKKARANAALSSEEIQKKQNKAMRKMLRYAYGHSDFYHKKFTGAGITRSNIDSLPIAAFPTTDKAEIVEHYSDVISGEEFSQQELLNFDESEATGLFRDKWHIVHSSGSTGVPRYFVYDEAAWHQLIIGGARSFFWGMSWRDMFRLARGKVNMLYVAVTGSRFGGAMMVSEAVKVLRGNLLSIDVNEPFETWKRKVVDFNPTIIMGYPSAVKVMTEELERSGVQLNVKRLISCGEALSPQQRQYLEHYYQTPVVNFYAATESLVLGVETDARHGMVLFDDMNYIEVINGTMYLTNLYNYKQPLIRYRISDSIEMMQHHKDKCRFSHCRVKLGRAEDMMWFSDSTGRRDFIHPTLLEDFCIQNLIGYQFVQKSRDSFRVNLEVAPGSNEKEICQNFREMVSRMLIGHRMGFVKFETRVVNHIMPDPVTGKTRLCIALPEEATGKFR